MKPRGWKLDPHWVTLDRQIKAEKKASIRQRHRNEVAHAHREIQRKFQEEAEARYLETVSQVMDMTTPPNPKAKWKFL